MGIADAIAPMSKYTQTHLRQLISAFQKEYPCSEYTIDKYGVVRCVTNITIEGMKEEECVGKFFYTSSGNLYFYDKRNTLLPKGMSNGFFRVDRTHRLIIDFMLHFKFKRLVSLVTKRRNLCIDKTFMEAEELYRVYWVKHDKS